MVLSAAYLIIFSPTHFEKPMKFALITEGASEHRIIKHFLGRYFRDFDPDINQIQPKMGKEKQESTGGWNEVLKYCGRDEIEDILIENDYLVVQIDTDQSQTSPFDVGHTTNENTPKSQEALYEDVASKLTSLFKPEVLEKSNNKILFAICMHTIECWLLPIYHSNTHKSDISNCLFTLNKVLAKLNMPPIPSKDKNSSTSIRTYEAILKNCNKKKEIIEFSAHNVGF